MLPSVTQRYKFGDINFNLILVHRGKCASTLREGDRYAKKMVSDSVRISNVENGMYLYTECIKVY
jgi:hypothetical protein